MHGGVEALQQRLEARRRGADLLTRHEVDRRDLTRLRPQLATQQLPGEHEADVAALPGVDQPDAGGVGAIRPAGDLGRGVVGVPDRLQFVLRSDQVVEVGR